jgi:hypothetical protein
VERCSSVCSRFKHPRKTTPWGGDRVWVGWSHDDTLTLFAAPTTSRTCVCALAQRWPMPASLRPKVATLCNKVRTQGQTCALCRRKTFCVGGTLDALDSRQLSGHVCVRYASNIALARVAYISHGGDASESTAIHQHNTPLQHTRTTATHTASSIATHSPQR